MAYAAALISLAAAYEKRFGRASLGALGELARQYAPPGADHGAAAPGRPAPIIAHLLARIASLKQEVVDIVVQPAARPAAECAEAVGTLAPAGQVDPASRVQLERGQLPLADWIRQKARKDMLAMSEQALREHLEDLEWIGRGPLSAVASAAAPHGSARESGADHAQLMNEVAAALHIGWLLQEGFSGAGSHAGTEAALLAQMTPYEREQYVVRKENARRRQEFRRKKPEVFSLDAARRRAMLTSRQGRPTN